MGYFLRLGYLVWLIPILDLHGPVCSSSSLESPPPSEWTNKFQKLINQMRLVDTFSDAAIVYLEHEVKKMNIGLQEITADEKENMALPMIQLYKSENNFKKTQALLDSLSKEENRSIKKMIHFLGMAKSELGQKELAKYLKFQTEKIETMSKKRLQLLKQAVLIYSKELSVWAQHLTNYKEYKNPNAISYRNFYINGYAASNKNAYWNSKVDRHKIFSGLPSFFKERENIYFNVDEKDSMITSQYFGLDSMSIEKSKKKYGDCDVAKIIECIGDIAEAIGKCVGHPDFQQCVVEILAGIEKGCKDCLPWFYTSNSNTYTIDDVQTSRTNGVQNLAEYSSTLTDCGVAEIIKCLGDVAEAIGECVSHPDLQQCIDEILAGIDKGCKDCLPWFYTTNTNTFIINDDKTTMTNGPVNRYGVDVN